ncbi:hypothetical protein [Acidiphilium sp. PM]|uniref:hypothetical protein n=1 Tax=Acidiphilium sp. PM TaxID=1043206 RepID=UPI00110FE00E|nr:hypothetical protein [Acidiphilium sp. PM]
MATEKSRLGVDGIFENWSEFIALASGVAAVAGAVYNWAYFAALGAPQLTEIFSISDEISSTITWLTGTIIIYLINYINFYFIAINSNQKYLSIFKRKITIYILFLLSFIIYLFTAKTDFISYIIVLIIWYYFSEQFISRFGLENSSRAALLVIVAPTLLCYSFLNGGKAGTAAGLVDHGNNIIKFSNGQIKKNVELLRILNNGLIYRIPKTGLIDYVSWNGYVRVGIQGKKPDTHLRICTDFGFFCSVHDDFASLK